MFQNIIGAFKSSKLYGPPDPDDRKRRQSYDEVKRQRKCVHNCMVIDVSILFVFMCCFESGFNLDSLYARIENKTFLDC